MTKTQAWCIYGIIVMMCGLRFWQLESAPPGFYLDESAGATHAICLSEDGTNASGVSFPLLFPTFPDVGAFTTPTYAYFAAVWVKAFGTSIGSFRGIAAFFTVLTIFGLFQLVRGLINTQAAALVALAASLSPWSFQFSRIAWDPPLMPCFLVWGLVCFSGRRVWQAVLSGVLFSLALYAYPAARLQLPLLLPLLVAFKFKEHQKRALLYSAVVLLSLIVTSLPLLQLSFAGPLGSRISNLSVFSSEHNGGSVFGGLKLFAQNTFAHFSPRYLFVSGDANLRHSTGAFGEMSWLDDYALLLAVVMGLGILAPRNTHRRERESFGRFRPLLVFAIIGFVAGVLPAALTWEGIPHALRSSGSWPFLSIVIGLLLWRAARISPRAAQITIGVGLIFAVLFSYGFFVTYPAVAESWFDSYVKDAAIAAQVQGDWSRFPQFATVAGYPPISLRYYLMHYGGMSCSESRRVFGD